MQYVDVLATFSRPTMGLSMATPVQSQGTQYKTSLCILGQDAVLGIRRSSRML